MNLLAAVSLALVGLLSAGCATQPEAKRDPRDPFERVNRATYKFNDALDRAILKPVAKGYVKVTPRVVRKGVTNFFNNLGTPVTLVNNVLQGKFKPAANDTGRFLMNTTIGLGGLFDPASAAGLDMNDEDFGQTLGKWGTPSGPYLVIPLMGPSTVRDGVATFADTYAHPMHYIEDDALRYGLYAVRLLDMRANLLEVEKQLDGAYDRYGLLRNVYLQRREYQVRDGDVPEEPMEEELLEGEGANAPQPN